MSDTSDSSVIVDDRDHHRFVLVDDDRDNDVDAELVYQLDGDRLILIHTEVDETLQGRGVGAHLVMAALDRARAENLTIVPWCPYARHWLREHPDATRTVSVDWHTPPQATNETSQS